MRTTVDVRKELLDEVLRVSKEKSRNRAIGKALEEYLKRKKIEEIKAHAGKLGIVDNLKELEGKDLERQRRIRWS